MRWNGIKEMFDRVEILADTQDLESSRKVAAVVPTSEYKKARHYIYSILEFASNFCLSFFWMFSEDTLDDKTLQELDRPG